jgi:spore maturation protein CgeB
VIAKLVIFGLTVSSSWGNGHATLWRGLISALTRRGWSVVFFEKDVPYYAGTRDLTEIAGGALILYPDWASIADMAAWHLGDADFAMVTSYCPDGVAATELVLNSGAASRVFYDLDTPVTLSRLSRGEETGYIGPRGLRDFDLVLSFTGGRALTELQSRLGAKRTAPLYGHVDPNVHKPVPPADRFAADLSYLGTYAEDRQAALEALFIEPARLRPDRRFAIGGALYPNEFPWTANIFFTRHLPPDQHATFFCSSRLTLNITRRDMVEMGWCPSGRLFEAAACGVPIISDGWPGLDDFFAPGRDIVLARRTEDALAALEMSDAELSAIGHSARQRVLKDHTSERRAEELERLLLDSGRRSVPAPQALEVRLTEA